MNGPQFDLRREFFIASCLVMLGIICLSGCNEGGDEALAAPAVGDQMVQVRDLGHGLVQTRATLPGATARQLIVERVMPRSVHLDEAFSYRISVLNQGESVAPGVIVVEQMPDGFELLHSSIPGEPVLDEAVSARPMELADLSARGELAETTYRWRIGDLGPGEQASFVVTTLPRRLGSGLSALAVYTDDVIETGIEVVSAALRLDLDLLGRQSEESQLAVPGELVTLTWQVRNTGNAVSESSILSLELPLGVELASEEAVAAGTDLRITEIPAGDLLRGSVALVVAPEATGVIRLSLSTGMGAKILSREVPVRDSDPMLDLELIAPEQEEVGKATWFHATLTNRGGEDLHGLSLVVISEPAADIEQVAGGDYRDETNARIGFDCLAVGEERAVVVVFSSPPAAGSVDYTFEAAVTETPIARASASIQYLRPVTKSVEQRAVLMASVGGL